jgi:hypothetical protein
LTWLMFSQWAANLTLGMLSLMSYLLALTRIPCSVSRWSKKTSYDSRWQCQTLTCQTVALFLDHNSLRRALHTRYSLYLALSDFRLFRYLKGIYQGSSFDEPDQCDELLSAIQQILSGVDPEILDAVFQKWMIRVQKCIDGNSEYVKWCLNWNVQFLFLNGRAWDLAPRLDTPYDSTCVRVQCCLLEEDCCDSVVRLRRKTLQRLEWTFFDYL